MGLATHINAKQYVCECVNACVRMCVNVCECVCLWDWLFILTLNSTFFVFVCMHPISPPNHPPTHPPHPHPHPTTPPHPHPPPPLPHRKRYLQLVAADILFSLSKHHHQLLRPHIAQLIQEFCRTQQDQQLWFSQCEFLERTLYGSAHVRFGAGGQGEGTSQGPAQVHRVFQALQECRLLLEGEAEGEAEGEEEGEEESEEAGEEGGEEGEEEGGEEVEEGGEEGEEEEGGHVEEEDDDDENS